MIYCIISYIPEEISEPINFKDRRKEQSKAEFSDIESEATAMKIWRFSLNF